jgi:hypothetical protein
MSESGTLSFDLSEETDFVVAVDYAAEEREKVANFILSHPRV